jgi:hypothetical protein
MTVPRRRRLLAAAVSAGLVALSAAGAQAASASRSVGACPFVHAAGKTWIVVQRGTTCATASTAVSRLAARTTGLHNGQTVKVPSPLPGGWTCVVRFSGHLAGSCIRGAGTATIIWESAT